MHAASVVPERRGEPRAATRATYLDNLKVLLVAAIIAIHGVLSYSSAVLWTYSDVREVTLSPVTEYAAFVVVAPVAFFMIALLFLVAGLLTPGSLERKGPARFARDRLVRLGLPFAAFVLLWPLLVRAMEGSAGMVVPSYWAELVDEEGHIDAGPLWFVGTLLIFSLAYAGCVAALRRAGRPRRATAPPAITAQGLWLLVAAVALTTFLVRTVHPATSESTTDLNLWEWPACAALFGLGITAARQGWLAEVPEALLRRSRTVTLVAGPALVVVFALGDAAGSFEDVTGGWTWQSAAFVAVESTLTVFGPIWLLGVFRRHLDRPLPWGPALSRSAYAAFVLQAPVLVGLALLVRDAPVAAEVKAVVVAGGGVVGSFALAWLVVDRVPGLRRVL